MFYSSVLIIMHTNVFIMLAMLGNYHHYLIQGFFFWFFLFCTQNRNSFPEVSGPTPSFSWDNLHISPRMTPVQIPYTREVIHSLSFHVRLISFKVLKIHWCYSMSLPTFAISTLYRKCFQFFFLHICSLYIPWILKRQFCSCVYDALPCSLPLFLALVPPVVLLLHSCMYIKFGTYI